MIVLLRLSDLVRKIRDINRDSWLVKVKMVITHRYIICTDVDDNVEFIRLRNDAVESFYIKLSSLYWAMLAHDYSGIGKIRPKRSNRYSKKLFELWKTANEKKLLTL